MLTDLRYAARALRKSPSFTLVAVLTLALGIGANAAIFTIVDAVLLKPLPYPNPDRLVMLRQDLSLRGGPADEWATPGNFFDWSAGLGSASRSPTFESMATATNWSPALAEGQTPEQLRGAQVTHTYFDTLGVRPVLGRGFQADEDVPNAPRVAVLSDALWQRRFGGDRTIVGRTIRLSGDPHLVVGVLPPGFEPAIVASAEVYRPLRLNAANPARGAVILRVLGRLRAGVDIEHARRGGDVLARRLEQAHPRSNERARIAFIPLHEQRVGEVRKPLLVLLAAVSLVLLIACVNVANLSLARALGRTREMAVRAALGASRVRLVRQLLTESVALAIAGGTLGLLLGSWAVRGLLAMAPAGLVGNATVALDARVVGYAILLTLTTVVVFGLVPALRVAAPAAGLANGSRTTTPGRRLRHVLVVVETAMAVLLLVGAGLLLRSFSRLHAFDLGFSPASTLAGRFVPSPVKHGTPDALTTLYDEILTRARALPGVRDASLTSVLPFFADSDMSLDIEGRAPAASESDEPVAWYRAVSASYLRSLEIPLMRGRGFDAIEPAPVVIVNETMSRRYWPGQDAVGKRLRWNTREPWATIVGVTRDTRSRGAGERPVVDMYVPYRYLPERGMHILLHGQDGRSVDALARPLRELVQAVDPDLPVAGIASLDEMLGDELARPRFLALLTGLFAALALLLAACGIYGVMAYAVSQRTREMGVRMALGARQRDVLTLVIGQACRLAVAGLVLGSAAAVPLFRTLRSLLFEVSPFDAATLGVTVTALLGCAFVASYAPARRAARVDPVVALRSE